MNKIVQHILALVVVITFTTNAFASGSDTTKNKLHLLNKEAKMAKMDSLMFLADSLIKEFELLEDYEAFLEGLYPTTDADLTYRSDAIPVFSDEIYEQRLKAIQKDIPLDFNQYVKNYIDVYTLKRREQVGKMLGISDYYFSMFSEVFAEAGIPDEFKHLAVVESALYPLAVSRVGATGMWQFMYATALQYDLKINSEIDERRDPYLATIAASQYFTRMYEKYGDWLLVIAAYNCGPGNVNKAIRRSGGKTNFWEIRRYLPRETRGYVPAFIAATYAMNYNEEHNIYPIASEYDFNTDTIMINRPMTFDQISSVLDISFEHVQYYNSTLRKALIPESALEKPIALRLPTEKKAEFLLIKDSVYAILDSIRENNPLFIEEYKPSVLTDAPELVYYKIRSGDNLGYIGEWFGVPPTQLRNWNNIRGNNIVAGKRLRVYVPNRDVSKYENINHMTFAQKQRINGSSPRTTLERTPIKIDPNSTYYVVKSGDTLWEIAKQIDGVTVAQLKSWNNISDHRDIKPGMKIKIG
ncbi:MAG: membrane-bound lytic murein transglycosylase D [Sphingobacteriales bacterium]|jgi:membrane-bound lytic murein transglycosylase D